MEKVQHGRQKGLLGRSREKHGTRDSDERKKERVWERENKHEVWTQEGAGNRAPGRTPNSAPLRISLHHSSKGKSKQKR